MTESPTHSARHLLIDRPAPGECRPLTPENQPRSLILAASHGPRFVALVDAVRPEIQECTIAEFVARRDQGDSFHLIDVREDSEFAAARIPGAVHLGKGIIERDIEAKFPDPATPLVLYCGGGYRSALAAANLQRMGYTNIVSMDGGFRGWKEAGLPIEA